MSPTSRTVENKPSLTDRLLSALPGAVVSIVLAFAISYVGVQRGQSEVTSRLTTAERDISEGKQSRERDREQMIGRKEFEAVMKSIDDSLKEIKLDVKELRRAGARKDD